MSKLKLAKFLLVFTAIIFVVKPFLGFSILTQLSQVKHTDSILIKIFSKRKPEFLSDAHEQKETVTRQLGRPPLKLIQCISALLTCTIGLCVSAFCYSNRFIRQLTSKLLPDSHPYLLAGKLTI